MAIEENIESQAQQAVTGILKTGAKGAALTVKIGARLAAALIAAGWSTGRGMVGRQRDTGRMSEKRLQSLGEDTHAIRLDESTLREVGRSLHEGGMRYAIERNGDGSAYLHFEGKDADHVTHAVERAFKRLGIDLDTDRLAMEPDERARSHEETPRQRTVATIDGKPGMPLPPSPTPAPAANLPDDWERPRDGMGVDHARVSEPDLENAIGDMAERHPELSYEHVMGDYQGHAAMETYGAIAGQRIAEDPRLGRELDTILHNRYEQPYTDHDPAQRNPIQRLLKREPAAEPGTRPISPYSLTHEPRRNGDGSPNANHRPQTGPRPRTVATIDGKPGMPLPSAPSPTPAPAAERQAGRKNGPGRKRPDGKGGKQELLRQLREETGRIMAASHDQPRRQPQSHQHNR